MASQTRPVRAWRLAAGSLSSLRPLPQPDISPPAAGEVVVAVRACGLNFADVFACLGLYSATPKGEFTPGLEFSGAVEETGEGVIELQVGDRVYGVTRFGGYATRLKIDARYVRRMPESWSFAEGAAFPVQAVTAYYGLFRLGAATKGSSVLVHSAAGGTGLWATKLCLAAGASVVGTVGSAGKAAELQRLAGLPADCIVDRSTAPSASREAALRAAAEAACGRPTFDVVFDSLLGEWFAPSYALLAPMGRHVVLGAGAMTPPDAGLGMLDWLRLGYQYLTRPTVDPLAMMSLNRSVMAFNLIWLYEAADLLGEVFAELAEATKELGPAHVGAEFAFEDAPAALRKLQGGETVGKVVLIVGDHGGGA